MKIKQQVENLVTKSPTGVDITKVESWAVFISIHLSPALTPNFNATQTKWHGIVVGMMACSPEDPGSIPRLAKVHNDVIFFIGVFMIQLNLI